MSYMLNSFELNHLLAFVGYGNLKGDVWFLGMEEDLGGVESLRSRLQYKRVEDLNDAYLKLGVKQTHQGWHTSQRVQWTISEFMLRLGGLDSTEEDIRNYRTNALGRTEGNTLLMYLMPLPKTIFHSIGKGSLVPQFSSQETYIELVMPERIRYLRTYLANYQPKVLICYGKEHWKDYRRLFPEMDFKPVGDFETAQRDSFLIVLCSHFADPRMKDQLESLVALIRARVEIETKLG